MGLVEDAEYLRLFLVLALSTRLLLSSPKLTGVAAGDASEDDVVSAAMITRQLRRLSMRTSLFSASQEDIANIFVPLLPGTTCRSD